MAIQQTSGHRRPSAASGTNARRLRDDIARRTETPPDAGFSGGPVDRRAQALELASFVPASPEALVADISAQWERAQHQFLGIGNNIILARELIERQVIEEAALQGLRDADRRALRDAEWRKFLARLPFTPAIATQLEKVARAIKVGQLRRDELPSNYSVAYQLTTLSPAELEAARRQDGVVGPAATRARIIAFKRRLRERVEEQMERARQRKERLLAAMARIQRELAEVERVLAGQGALSAADEENPGEGA